MALLVAPQLAIAGGKNSAVSRNAEAPGSFKQSRYDMAISSSPDVAAATELSLRKFAPESRGARETEGARFGDGEVQYIEGPAWDYRTSRRGPLFELGALGGGMENAPYLAHVAMNWRF